MRNLTTTTDQFGHFFFTNIDMNAAGTVVQVKKEGFNMVFKVVELIEKRVGAPIAQKCYENLTPEEEMNKFVSSSTIKVKRIHDNKKSSSKKFSGKYSTLLLELKNARSRKISSVDVSDIQYDDENGRISSFNYTLL